jgi:cellobiose-specific phosphotransferase system component IIB
MRLIILFCRAGLITSTVESLDFQSQYSIKLIILFCRDGLIKSIDILRQYSMKLIILFCRAGLITSTAKSLDILRQNIQKFINKEIDVIIKDYMEVRDYLCNTEHEFLIDFIFTKFH